MTIIKKTLLSILIVLLILIGVGWIFIQEKQKESIALSQYIPESQYVARFNTKQAIKLVINLDKDSFKIRKKSRWSAIFNDSTNTGIDKLVNPWVFGSGKQLNVAFSIKSSLRFNAWMNEICDSTKGAWLDNGDSVYYFHFTGKPITFYHNTSGVAIMSLGNKSKSVATSFFENPKTSNNMLEMNNELIQVKLSGSNYFMDSLFCLQDSVVRLFVTENYLKINEDIEPSFEEALLISKPLDEKSFAKIKDKKPVKALFQYLGLKELELTSNANMVLVLKDTLQRHIKTVSYVYNDNFEKVEVIKRRTSILPNITLLFEFKDKEGAAQFYSMNKLKDYKSRSFYARQIGSSVSISSSFLIHQNYARKKEETIAYLDKEKCEFVLSKCKGLNFLSLEVFDGMDYLYVYQSNGKTSLALKSFVHPVQFLYNNFSEKISW